MNKVEVLEQNHNKYCISAGCSNGYVPYLSVYLSSIMQHSNDSNFYDIVIFESDITDENKEILLSMVNKPNFSLRFYDCSELFDSQDLYISTDYFAKQCYYRLAVGKVLANYEKAIYSDIDLIFNTDVYELFSTDMGDCPIGAVEELMWTMDEFLEKDIKLNYPLKNYVHYLVKGGKYYNTGVVLFDIKKFNETYSFEDLIKMALSYEYVCQEQCLLNEAFLDRIYKLDDSWNFEIHPEIFNNETEKCKTYMSKINEAKVYHWLAKQKVWFNPTYPKALLWWQYAKESPFYVQMLTSYVDFKTKPFESYSTKINNLVFIIKEIQRYYKNKLLYIWYQNLANFTFGKLKSEISQRKYHYRNLVNNVDDFLNDRG